MISKAKLQKNLDTIKSNTKVALQTVFDNLNRGQQKKVLNVYEVRELFERYGVDTGQD